MGFNQAAKGLVLLVAVATLLSVSDAETIVVGGSEKWRFGFNYSDWAIKHGPFYRNDKLVFKYDPPSNTTAPYDVYLLPNYWSYKKCNFTKAKLVANTTQGGGDGFSYVLNKLTYHYFACSQGNGSDCDAGLMKFIALPRPRKHA